MLCPFLRKPHFRPFNKKKTKHLGGLEICLPPWTEEKFFSLEIGTVNHNNLKISNFITCFI
jgi:hypothetical protein